MQKMTIKRLTLVTVATLACLHAGFALAQGVDEETEPTNGQTESCIRVTDVRRTSVIDDQTILFYLRRGGVYRNHLRSSCRGLTRGGGRFSYTARGGRLCSVDTITVPDPIDRNLRTGMTCRLGEFEILSARETELIVQGASGDTDDGLVTVTDIELPQDNDEAVPDSDR